MNKKKLILMILALNISTESIAKSKLPTQVAFSVHAPAKEITGTCSSAQVWIDRAQGTIQADIPVDSISFKNNFSSDDMNDVIRERFRNYYMESISYPVISFKGNFNPDSLRRSINDSSQPFQVCGTLIIHGISKNIKIDAHTYVKNGKRILMATILVAPDLYGIRIPAYIGKMYFKEVAIQVEAMLN